VNHLRFAVLAMTVIAGAAQAAPPPDSAARAVVLQSVLDCRSVADKDQRLTCYDAAVGRLDLAQSKGEVVVVDREQVRAVKRQTFGLQLPSLASFLPKGQEDEADRRVELVITSVATGADGHQRYGFADGSVWEQTEYFDFPKDPRAGMKAQIERGTLGSFFMKIDHMSAVRVRRER
jgi:hypothetical protein